MMVIIIIIKGWASPGSSVGIATRYGLDGPGIESRWGRDFSAPVQTGPGAHPASYTIGTGSLSRGVKRPAVALTTHLYLAPKLKERVELYLCSPLCAFVACHGVNFTFSLNTQWLLERQFGRKTKQPCSLLSDADAKNTWRPTSTLMVRFRGLVMERYQRRSNAKRVPT